MYTSLNAHIENGRVVLDEPMSITGKAKAIVTILEIEEPAIKNGENLANVLRGIAEKAHSYNDVDGLGWQKEIRKDNDLPRNS